MKAEISINGKSPSKNIAGATQPSTVRFMSNEDIPGLVRISQGGEAITISILELHRAALEIYNADQTNRAVVKARAEGTIPEEDD